MPTTSEAKETAVELNTFEIMSYCIAEVLNACPSIQKELTSHFQTCNHTFLREPYPFFEFVKSELNNTGLSQEACVALAAPFHFTTTGNQYLFEKASGVSYEHFKALANLPLSQYRSLQINTADVAFTYQGKHTIAPTTFTCEINTSPFLERCVDVNPYCRGNVIISQDDPTLAIPPELLKNKAPS